MSDTKRRQMVQSAVPESDNEDIRKLATIGMRIRKVVAEGYCVPGNPIYDSAERVPLPSHMSNPPTLTNGGSTFQSGSSLESWNQNYSLPLQTISQPDISNKRKRDELEDMSDRDLDQFKAKYGSLSFNDDF